MAEVTYEITENSAGVPTIFRTISEDGVVLDRSEDNLLNAVKVAGEEIKTEYLVALENHIKSVVDGLSLSEATVQDLRNIAIQLNGFATNLANLASSIQEQ